MTSKVERAPNPLGLGSAGRGWPTDRFFVPTMLPLGPA
jgi:hypothetical protein